MILKLKGLEDAVSRLFQKYILEGSIRQSVERIIDDFDEIITLSRACELVIYRRLNVLTRESRSISWELNTVQDLLDLQSDITDAVMTISSELDYQDKEAIRIGEVNIGTNAEGIANQFAH